MAVQTRTTALRNEYVRLYCRFIYDGQLTDPNAAPIVYITGNSYYQESSSSSTSSIDSYSSSSLSSLSSSTETKKLTVNVKDSLGVTMGTFTSEVNRNTGTNIVFNFDDALSHEEFPSVLTFSSFLPELACGSNAEITTTWETNTGDFWSTSATWSSVDSYYFIADTSLALKLHSITIDVCSHMSSSTSSSSSDNSSLSSSMPPGTIYGPFTAVKEHTGLWYVDWLVPNDIDIGRYFDIWKFKWLADGDTQTQIFELIVNKEDKLVNSIAPAKAYNFGDTVYGLMNDLSNNFIYEAMHIPVYWEQGYKTGDGKSWNFAYNNWNRDPRPVIRINQKIRLDGWEPNYGGNVYFNKPLDPEDMVYAQYNFRYFSWEEIADFLNMGLYAMNATPPASLVYSNLNTAPFEWRFGILLYAAIKAIQRLVFGLSFQERALIFAEKPENVQAVIANLRSLYADYNALWIEVKKDVKTLKLPGIAQISVPEYTLPGGRSRWFRYLYKTNV